MKAKLVQVIRTETVEGDGKKESPVHSVERYWTLEGELLAEKVYMGKQQVQTITHRMNQSIGGDASDDKECSGN